MVFLKLLFEDVERGIYRGILFFQASESLVGRGKHLEHLFSEVPTK